MLRLLFLVVSLWITIQTHRLYEQTESVTESAMILVGRVFVWRQQARILGTRLAPAARIIR